MFSSIWEYDHTQHICPSFSPASVSGEQKSHNAMMGEAGVATNSNRVDAWLLLGL